MLNLPLPRPFEFKPDLEEFERLPAASVYQIVADEGRKELRRPATSLWWSAVAAGFAMGASVVGLGAFHLAAPADPGAARLLVSLGYPFGFAIVILSRLQLFTENTVTPILPLLLEPTRRRWAQTGRLWLLVLVGNLVGAAVFAALTVHGGLVAEPLRTGMIEVSSEFLARSPTETFSQGLLAGFLIAALVWMLPTVRGGEVLAIFLVTYLIGISGAPHVIAGAVEMFVAALAGRIGVGEALGLHILPTLGGNVLGGTGLFAMLAFGQVWRELRDGAPPPRKRADKP